LFPPCSDPRAVGILLLMQISLKDGTVSEAMAEARNANVSPVKDHPFPSPQRKIFGYLSFQVLGTLVSRAAGFVRELVTAVVFGAGASADAFIAALTIPTLFRDVLGEDVVERSFMPGIREHLARKNHADAWRLASVSLNWMLVALVLGMGVLWVAAPWLVDLVAAGIHQRSVSEGTVADVIAMTRILIPFLVFIALGAYVGGVLYYGFDFHLVFSLAPTMLSVGVIAIVLFSSQDIGIYALAWGFTVGAVLQFAVQVPFLGSQKIRSTNPEYTLSLRLNPAERSRISRETAHVALQSLLTKTTEIVDRRVASFLVEGSISSLWFAARLVQLPFAIIGIAIGRAIAPYLSEKVGTGDLREFKNAVLIGYRYNLVLVLPVIGLFTVLAHPFVRLIYERGNFGAHDTSMTASAFWAYALGLLGLSLYTLGTRICSALEHNRVATYTAVLGAGLNVWLNYVLSATFLRHAGLALATSIAFSVNAALLLMWVHRYLAQRGQGFRTRELLVPFLRVLANTAGAVLAAWVVFAFFVPESWFVTRGFAASVGAFCVPFVGGFLVYLVLAVINPVAEIEPVKRWMKRSVIRFGNR